MTKIIDFDKITNEEKEALHIISVSGDHIDFRIGDFGKMLQLYKYKDGDLAIEIDDSSGSYTLTKEQMIFTAKWMAYSR
jgi:uncharacterized protein Usg